MRYRVEVDQTLTHEVYLEAETVEDAMRNAQAYVERFADKSALESHTTARDAVEVEKLASEWPMLPEATKETVRCDATRNDSQCVYYGTHTLPHRAYDAHRSEFTWSR